MVVGKFNSGKSLLIRSLVASSVEYVLPVDGAECTSHLFHLEYSSHVRYEERTDGTARELDEGEFIHLANIARLNALERENAVNEPIRSFAVGVPSPFLKGVQLVDTVGTNGVTAGRADRAYRALKAAAETADLCLFVVETPGLGEDAIATLRALREHVEGERITFVLSKTDLEPNDSVRAILVNAKNILQAEFGLCSRWFCLSAAWEMADTEERQRIVSRIYRDDEPPIHEHAALVRFLLSQAGEREIHQLWSRLSRSSEAYQQVVALEAGYSRQDQASNELLYALPELWRAFPEPIGPNLLKNALKARGEGRAIPWDMLGNFGISEATLAPSIDLKCALGLELLQQSFQASRRLGDRLTSEYRSEEYARMIAQVEALERTSGERSKLLQESRPGWEEQLSPLLPDYDYERELMRVLLDERRDLKAVESCAKEVCAGLAESIGMRFVFTEQAPSPPRPLPWPKLLPVVDSSTLVDVVECAMPTGAAVAVEVAMQAGLSLELEGRLHEAMDHLRAAARLAEDVDDAGIVRSVALISLSRCALLQGDSSSGFWFARDAVAVHPSSTSARKGLVRILFGLKDWHAALSESRELTQRAGGDPEAHYLVGRCHFALDMHNDAAESFRRALTQEGCDAKVRVWLGRALFQLQRYAEAEAELNEARRNLPINSRAHTWLGATLTRLDRSDEAQTVLQHAVKLDSSDPNASFWLGISLAKLDQFFEAEAAFSTCIRLRPHHVEALLEQSRCLHRTARYPLALSQAKRAVELGASGSEADVILSDAEWAACLLGQNSAYERISAATAIAASLRPWGIAPLFQALADRTLWLTVTGALKSMHNAGLPVMSEASIQACSSNHGIRSGTMNLLSGLQHPQALLLIRQGLADASAAVRLEAIHAIAVNAKAGAVPDLINAYDVDVANRRQVVQYLVSLGDGRSLPCLVACVQNKAEGSDIAFGFLLVSKDQQIVPALIAYLPSCRGKDRRPAISKLADMQAVEAIDAIGSDASGADEEWEGFIASQLSKFKHPKAVDALANIMLKTKFAVVCRQAAEGLQSQGNARAIPALQQRLKACPWFFDHGAREAMRRAISALGGTPN